MRCGQLVSEIICVAQNMNANSCSLKKVTLIEVKATTTCATSDMVLLTDSELTARTAQTTAYAPLPTLDPVDVSTVFFVGFSTVLTCFLVARGAGTILNLIRRG